MFSVKLQKYEEWFLWCSGYAYFIFLCKSAHVRLVIQNREVVFNDAVTIKIVNVLFTVHCKTFLLYLINDSVFGIYLLLFYGSKSNRRTNYCLCSFGAKSNEFTIILLEPFMNEAVNIMNEYAYGVPNIYFFLFLNNNLKKVRFTLFRVQMVNN